MKKLCFVIKLISVISILLLHPTFTPISIVIAGEWFQPKNCEFSVEFPGKYKIAEIVIPPNVKLQSAEFYGIVDRSSGYVFTAECFAVSRSDILKGHDNIKSYLLDSAQEYAFANGIQFPEFRHFEDKIGDGILMRGYKTISGQKVIYSTITVIGNSSIISLRVGAPASIFPPPGYSSFIKSVRRK